jgi:outer membrane protein TolC
MAMVRITLVSLITFAGLMQAQATTQVQTQAPLTLTLKDALARAQANAPAVLAAMNDASLAHEDLLQARAGLLPSASFKSDYLGTQGNGQIPSGRFVTNDGVHVYRDWGVVHQDFTAAVTKTGPRRAIEAEALANAKVEIARRGLAATVTKAYYTLLASQRKYATAQAALDQAQRSLDLSRSLERGGEVAHSDVVKADLQHANQGQRSAGSGGSVVSRFRSELHHRGRPGSRSRAAGFRRGAEDGRE